VLVKAAGRRDVLVSVDEGKGMDCSLVRWHAVRAHPRVLVKGITMVGVHSRGSLKAGVIERQTRQIRP
jgi:hypothetical protein